MRKVKLGIIGCGVIGQVHLQHATASPLTEVVAVADIREVAAEEAARKFGVPNYYGDAESVFRDPEIEAVILAVQTHVRTDLAVQAFSYGKHVLLEKPAALNTDEVRRMIEARGDLVAGCCSARYRYYDSAAAAESLVASGSLGELRVIRCRNTGQAKRPAQTPPLWQFKKSLNGGGILADWGVYDLDYMMGITGWKLKPRTVLGHVWPISPVYASYIDKGSDAETHAAAFIGCEGGTVISYERGTQVPGEPEQAWQIIGSNGTLQLHMLPKNEKELVFYEASEDQGIVKRTIWKGEEGWSNVHTGPIRDFVEAIIEGRQPKTSLEHSLFIMNIVEAVYRSSETGVAVGLPD